MKAFEVYYSKSNGKDTRLGVYEKYEDAHAHLINIAQTIAAENTGFSFYGSVDEIADAIADLKNLAADSRAHDDEEAAELYDFEAQKLAGITFAPVIVDNDFDVFYEIKDNFVRDTDECGYGIKEVEIHGKEDLLW